MVISVSFFYQLSVCISFPWLSASTYFSFYPLSMLLCGHKFWDGEALGKDEWERGNQGTSLSGAKENVTVPFSVISARSDRPVGCHSFRHQNSPLFLLHFHMFCVFLAVEMGLKCAWPHAGVAGPVSPDLRMRHVGKSSSDDLEHEGIFFYFIYFWWEGERGGIWWTLV